MDPLRRVSTRGHVTDNSASHSPHPSGHRVLPPFSGTLKVDEKLKLSHVDFIQTIRDFFPGKVVTPLCQLTSTPAFPTPHVMAQFAYKTYRDYIKGETDAQYETRLDLPDGWKLLTTASNSSKTNGYFGAAYWHPEHQQVVIAHRGSKLTNLGALWTDLFGVMFKHHVPQMGSASTFAHEVVKVLRAVNQEKGTNLQLFFTGHSLGGWLAQITTFTTKYLQTEGNTFLKSDTVPQSFHPHTVVFDSPGCKDMLSQMTDKLDVRLDGRSIDLEHLDITSYLSAPNRINTCNRHVGTVYRIFPDLSDMGWREKNTVLYNLATHSMDKIVDFFDPQKEQIHKDGQGKLKIQLVVDWPVTAGLSRVKEYKSFFKWAKHLNNYKPEITGETLKLKKYHSIRYQVVTYDERVSRLSVFCQQERQFLESYRWLRQLPEFFKPKELFVVMGNNQAQEEAEKILQGFEIENDTIRCTDATELEKLIPYVKRLLEIFPQLKENTDCVLTPKQIRNNVYQFVTKRYVETLRQNPLDIMPDESSLRDFLNSDEQKVLQLRMFDMDAWTGLIKVYRVLEKTDRLSEGHYTILTLEHLLIVNRMLNLNTLLQSTTAPHLLMLSCDTNQVLNVETKQIFERIFNTLQQKQSVKIILTTQPENDTVNILQDIAKETLGKGFITRDERLTWCDLTPSCQEKLLENRVNFQGCEIALHKLISPDSTVAHFLPLAELLEKRHLKIGEDPLSNCSCNYYDESFYIERTFTHHVFMKHDILNGHRVRDFPDSLANNEEEFEQLCQLNPKCNVHWIEKDKSGKLLWQKSQGSLETIRRYIDTESLHTFTADDLDKLLEQAQHQRVMLISDTAGMGKSTLLTHLSKQMKQKFPTKWVVRIHLNDHTDDLKALQEGDIGKEKAIEFVSEKIMKHNNDIEVELFKQCCEQKQKVRVVIMFDGFDEVCPFYKQTVIDLLQTLRRTAVEQLWVTTRPHLRNELEDSLQQLSYKLEPFSEDNQVKFLTKFWSVKTGVIEKDTKEKDEKKTKLAIYAKHLIRKLNKSISDKDKVFTGIALQCRMLAEAFEENITTFCESAEFVPELNFNIDLLGLYEIFMSRKYDICAEEKFKIPKTNVGAEVARKQWVETNVEKHQILALNMLFADELLALLHINSHCTSFDEDLTRTGIVQISNEGKLHFIHRTFAEFYVADYFVNKLTKRSNISQHTRDFLLQKIFLDQDYQVVRVFIDGLLSRSKPSNEVLKEYGNQIHDLRVGGEMTFHLSAREGNANIVGFLLESVQVAGHTDTLVELLLSKYYDKQTALEMAPVKGQQVLLKLQEWAKKEKQQTQDLYNKVSLVKDVDGWMAWHVAANEGQLQVLNKLWEWATKVLTPVELNNKLFLAKDIWGRTAWHMATENGKLELLHKLWEWANEVLTPKKSKQIFFLNKDNGGRTAWYMAVETGKVELLYKLWEWAKQVLTAEELNNMAAENGKLGLSYKIWQGAKKALTPEEINNNFS